MFEISENLNLQVPSQFVPYFVRTASVMIEEFQIRLALAARLFIERDLLEI